MASKLNSEFNYRYLVIGETIWEKIKTLKGFLEGRKRAAVLEEVAALKYKSQLSKLQWMKDNASPEWEILELQATITEVESVAETLIEAHVLNRDEIRVLESLLQEAFAIAEPTRIAGYTDDQMFEANAANEFTMLMARTIQSEIIAQGRPLPATIKNAMSNPHTFNALKIAGLVPMEAVMLCESRNPLQIEVLATAPGLLPNKDTLTYQPAEAAPASPALSPPTK